MALLLSGSFDSLSNLYTLVSWVSAVFMICAIFVSRRRDPDASRPYRVFGYPVVPALFAVVGAWLVVQTAVSDPHASAFGVGAIALAFVAYAIRRRVATKSV